MLRSATKISGGEEVFLELLFNAMTFSRFAAIAQNKLAKNGMAGRLLSR